MFIPVDFLGGPQTRDFGVLMEELFESDNQVSIFPAGTCAKRVNGKVPKCLEKNVVTRAEKSHRDVIPIHCTGRNSNWFYLYRM